VSGYDVRVLVQDAKNDKYPVVCLIERYGVEYAHTYTDYGVFNIGSLFVSGGELDLVEVTPYDDLKEGDVCLVWNETPKYIRIYSGDGFFYIDGFHQTSTVVTWKNYKKLGINIKDAIDD
jgi:hypothetical protein